MFRKKELALKAWVPRTLQKQTNNKQKPEQWGHACNSRDSKIEEGRNKILGSLLAS